MGFIVMTRVLSMAAFLLCTASDSEGTAAPNGLLVQLLRYPERALIVERAPYLSWIVSDGARGAVQTAYQIQVASSPESLEGDAPDVWDSGKVASAESVGVPYAGPPLASNTCYHWRVRVWTGRESPYSHPQQFYTGDLEAVRTWPAESRWCRLPDASEANWALENRQAMRFEDRAPVSFIDKGNHSYFIDFGKAAFGKLQINVASRDDGAAMEVYTGEKTAGADSVDREPGGNIAHQQFILKTREGKHGYTLQPDRHRGPIPLPEHLGEVFPFRYVEILNAPGPLTKQDVKQQALVYPFDDKASSFSSSSGTLNDVWDLCKYTMKATNFLGVFIDGQRERIPYEADAYINQMGYYCVDREFAIARYSHEYLLYHPTWPTEWILQSPLMAWNDFLYTGHPDSLRKFYEDLRAKTLRPLARPDGLISTLCVNPILQEATPGYTPSAEDTRRASEVLAAIHLGDKLKDIVDWPKGERDGYVFTPVNTVVNAFYCAALRNLADIARVAGTPDDADLYRRAADDACDAFNAKLFDSAAGLYVDGEGTKHISLHGNLFPLALGLVPEERKAGLVAFMRGKGMACSVYAAQWLLEALYETGQADYALALMTDTRSDRSWPHMIQGLGSTVTLEAWDMQYKPNADWNHAWGAAPANIIARKLMGIEPIAPGYAKARICPQPGTLEWATITTPTIRGTIELAYHKEGAASYYEVRIPANMSAEIHLPVDTPARVTESKNPISEATGVTYLRQERGRAVFAVGAGKYAFCTR